MGAVIRPQTLFWPFANILSSAQWRWRLSFFILHDDLGSFKNVDTAAVMKNAEGCNERYFQFMGVSWNENPINLLSQECPLETQYKFHRKLRSEETENFYDKFSLPLP